MTDETKAIPDDGPADFQAAMAWMQAGKKAKRAYWPKTKFLSHPGLASTAPGKSLAPFTLTNGKDTGVWHTTTEDLNAEDWMVAQ